MSNQKLCCIFRFPYLLVLLAPFVLLSPLYLTGRVLFWGTPLLQFIPWWDYAWRTLLAGHLPLWNPLVGMGAPLLGNYQSTLLYPPTWIYLILYIFGGVKLMAWGQALMIALHLAWASLGMALLVRRLGLGALAQVVTGMAFGLSGYLVARAWFLSINAAVAWFPWVLMCLTSKADEAEYVLRPGSSRFYLLVICLALQLLAGHAQTTWYTLLLAALWVAFWAWQISELEYCFPKTGTHLSRIMFRASRLAFAWMWLVIAVMLAMSIAAIQLLPTAEYLSQSQRATAVEQELTMTYSFWPWHLLNFLAPGLFGSPVNGDYWGYANYWEDAIYIGWLPILLALGTMLGSLTGRRKIRHLSSNLSGNALPPGSRELERQERQSDLLDRLVYFLLCIMLVALLLALGKNTPVYPWLYSNIPTFGMFQAPTRWMLWVVFALSLLAAIGMERWRKPEGWKLYWTRLGTAGAFAVSLGAGLAWYAIGEINPSFIRATTLLGFFGLGAGILGLTAPPCEHEMEEVVSVEKSPARSEAQPEISSIGQWRKRLFHFKPPPSRRHSPGKPYPLHVWQWAVALFVAFDLLVMHWGLCPAGDLDLYESSPVSQPVKLLMGSGRLFISSNSEYWLKYIRFLRFDTFNPGEDWRNFRAILLPNSNILDNIASVNNYDPLVPERYADWMEMLEEAKPGDYQRMLELMDVGAIERLSRDQPYGVRFDQVHGIRTRWVHCAQLANDPVEARGLIVRGQIDFNRQVLLEGLVDLPTDNCQPPKNIDDIAAQNLLELLDERDPNLVEIRVVAASPAWLVLSDVWYPGWQAWVDNQPVPILRANYLFRAVRVPEGEHRVTFLYRPTSFWMGLAISTISLLIMIVSGHKISISRKLDIQ